MKTRGRPRHLAKAIYAQKRHSEDASQGQIANELSDIGPQEGQLEKRQIRRWVKDLKYSTEPTDKEVARVFAWAEGIRGWTNAHRSGRPDFRVHLTLHEGKLKYGAIWLEGITPWKELAMNPMHPDILEVCPASLKVLLLGKS